MAKFHEDGWVAEVEVLKDTSDEKWLRYELKVIHTLAESSIMKTPPNGEIFSVEQMKGIGFGGMWFLTDYENPNKE